MTTRMRALYLAAALLSGFLLAPVAHAECGGNVNCIGVSITAAPPFHGSPLVSAPIAYGNQTIGTTSATRTILVAGVLGPAGAQATLNAITLGGANAADFTIASTTCTTGAPSLLHNGAVTANLADTCAINVTFNPATLGAKTANVVVSSPIPFSRTVPLTGAGTGVLPAAGPASMTVPRNTPTTLDLAPYISGLNLQGVRITVPPANGTATISGTSVTYTPARDYVGPDTMSYESFSAVATSPPAVISVSVVFRTDPSKDPSVTGMIEAQTQAVRRFSRAQISNIQRRMESLHRGPDATAVESNGFRPAARPQSIGLGLRRRPPSALDPGQPVPAGRAGAPYPADPDNLGSGVQLASLLTPVLNSVSTNSLNLSNVGETGNGSSQLTNDYGVWIGGVVNFGHRDQGSASDSLKFSTDGISLGIDRRISNKLALGMGLGYARDESEIGAFGTRNKASGWSIAGYGSYQPTEHTYIDGLIGYGNTRHDMERYVASANALASANRKGDQLFASLAAGYEYRNEGLLVSPYGRLDYAYDRLDQTSESGAGLNSLTYFEQTFPTLQLALGLRAESIHETDFGWAQPRLRVEFRHNIEDNADATIAYADQFAGPRYSVSPRGIDRNALLLGIGSDFIFRRGLRLGFDYQVQHASGLDSNQAIRFWLSKDLDDGGVQPRKVPAVLSENPLRVEAGYTWNDNLNRANVNALSDHVYSLNVSKGTVFSTSRHTQVVLTGLLNGEKLHTYSGLDRISGGVNAELQYRSSGDFFTPTFGLFGRAMLDAYDSTLRDGYRYSFGLNARQALSDRINLFAALAHRGRNADSTVFDGSDDGVRFNLDYALGRSGAIYLGGEYRRGDLVSSGPLSPGYAAIAKNVVPDDAYPGRQFFAYRYEAKTVLWTLGYNLPLGPRDSIDFSWRRANSTPTRQASGSVSGPYGGGTVYGGSQDYTTNQYSVFYLMRF